MRAPAEVNLLHMRKERAIKPSHRVVEGTSYYHTGSRCPKDLHWAVILPLILLYRGENSAAAEGKTIFVQKTAAGAGILKDIPAISLKLGFAQYFRHTDTSFPMLLHKLQQYLQPVALSCTLTSLSALLWHTYV